MQVILADDHDLVRDTLEAFLKRLGDDVRVLHAANLPQAVELAREAGELQLILLDLRMPGMNGLAGLKTMRTERPEVPVVILSGEVNSDTVRGALQAGAAGFIPKTMRATAMLNALRLVLSGERYVPDLLLTEATTPAGGAPAPGSRLDSLTPRERQVVGELVKGLSNREIARNLSIEEVTVALHLRSIYRKLDVESRTQAVRLALQLGWEF